MLMLASSSYNRVGGGGIHLVYSQTRQFPDCRIEGSYSRKKKKNKVLHTASDDHYFEITNS